ncbi:demethoxyubiquinone hydroxylase family protein [Tistrella mobilis]|uniref:demethoxyubiquinone hydroxylase family protein n=1 Tax=Tistrella mobilis TaxID=171437 RepID=UPI0035582970
MTDEPRTPDSRPTAARSLPGDPDPRTLVERMIRVDQAGEYGAARIYAGQLAVMGKGPHGATIRHMADQERVHLETFNRMMVDRRVRPTLLSPVWHAAGFALGAVTAAMGPRAAMACTVAVEEEIDRHYRAQSAALGPDEAPLRDTIERFRAEELEHRDTGLAHGAEQATGYKAMKALIGAGSRLAIWLSTRL